MATRVTAGIYRQLEMFLPLSVFPIPSFYRTPTPLPFSYSFSRFLAGYRHTHEYRLGEGKPRISLMPPRGFPYYLQAPTCSLPPLLSPAITRSGSANALACHQIGGNRGRRNLSRSVTTLSDVAARGSDVQMCPLEGTEENMIAR